MTASGFWKSLRDDPLQDGVDQIIQTALHTMQLLGEIVPGPGAFFDEDQAVGVPGSVASDEVDFYSWQFTLQTKIPEAWGLTRAAE